MTGLQIRAGIIRFECSGIVESTFYFIPRGSFLHGKLMFFKTSFAR